VSYISDVSPDQAEDACENLETDFRQSIAFILEEVEEGKRNLQEAPRGIAEIYRNFVGNYYYKVVPMWEWKKSGQNWTAIRRSSRLPPMPLESSTDEVN
jgi:hypothetical protein